MRKLPPIPPIKKRIEAALSKGPLEYRLLAVAVFPESHFPRAFNHARGNSSGGTGGPPGCYMALSRAIREMGLWRDGHGPGSIIHPKRRRRR